MPKEKVLLHIKSSRSFYMLFDVFHFKLNPDYCIVQFVHNNYICEDNVFDWLVEGKKTGFFCLIRDILFILLQVVITIVKGRLNSLIRPLKKKGHHT